jgi:hypothetical protein
MDRFLLLLQSLIWPAVISAVLSILSILTVILTPDKGTLALALGLSAVAWAGLAQTV